jgi:hypothetical protein
MNTREQVYVFYQQECDPNESHHARGHANKYAPIFTEKEWEEYRRINLRQEEEKIARTKWINDQKQR